MADANKITIEVVDGGTKGGSSSSSSSSSSTPPPLPKAKKKGGKDDNDIAGAVADRLGMGGALKDAKAAGAGLGSAAGAAGIVGLALMGIQQVTASMQGLAKTADKVSAGLVGMVDNKFMSGSDLTNGLAEMQEGIPIIGEMLGAQTRLQGAILNLPEKLSDAFLQRAKQLSGFSGNIAGAEAKADVRSVMADLREAQELGPAMGRMIDAQSQLEVELRELLLPIKKFVIEVLADRLEFIANGAKVISNLPSIIDTIGQQVGKAIIDALELEFTEAKKKINAIPDKLDEVMGKKAPPPDELFNSFFAGADRQAGGFAG